MVLWTSHRQLCKGVAGQKGGTVNWVEKKWVKETADRYQKEYGFMAVNATMRNAELFHQVHDCDSADELKPVHDELIRRGLKVVKTEAEYKALVAEHGLPPAFDKTPTW